MQNRHLQPEQLALGRGRRQALRGVLARHDEVPHVQREAHVGTVDLQQRSRTLSSLGLGLSSRR